MHEIGLCRYGLVFFHRSYNPIRKMNINPFLAIFLIAVILLISVWASWKFQKWIDNTPENDDDLFI